MRHSPSRPRDANSRGPTATPRATARARSSSSPAIWRPASCRLLRAIALRDSTCILLRTFFHEESRVSDPGVAMKRQVKVMGAAGGLEAADQGGADAPGGLAPLLEARLEACGISRIPGRCFVPSPASGERR